MAPYGSDEDEDTLPTLVQDSRTSTARGAPRRAGSRASSVASLTAAGGPASRTARQPSYERGTSAGSTSRTAFASRSAGVRASVSASPVQTAFESDTPTVAAYRSTGPARHKEASQTPPPVARPKPKRAVLSPEAKKQLEKRRQLEQAEDDFFTRKPALAFRTKKAVQKTEPSRAESSSTSQAGPSRTSPSPLNNPSASPPPSTATGKARVTVIELDSDESSGSSLHDNDDDVSSGESDDPYATGTTAGIQKGKSKRSKQKLIPNIPRFSPVKRQEPDTDSSSSSGYSFTSSSSIQRIRKDKHQGKKKKLPDAIPPPAPKRSLSPIETVDSYVVQHALQDLRRKNNDRQHQSGDTFTSPSIDTGSATIASPLTSTSGLNEVNGNHRRSPSAGTSAQVDPIQRPLSFSLTPLPETKTQTEGEQELKFGTAVSIRVEMVYDPRVPVLSDLDRQLVKTYESPVIVKTRQKETFHRLFEAVSKFKDVSQDLLTFTYNGKTVYKSGSPVAIQIISSATFKGYTKDVLSYIRLHPESVRKRQESESSTLNGATSGPSGTAAPSLNPSEQPISTDPINSHATSNTGQTSTQAGGASPEVTQSAALRLTIRGGSDQKVLLAVPPNKTVLSVIKHFLRKFNIDQAKAGQCKLLFDGEEIEHDLRLGQTEVEDEDTLDIKVPT